MANLVVKLKVNGAGEPIKITESFCMDLSKVNDSDLTKSIRVRIGFMNGTKFLSFQGQSGDICRMDEGGEYICRKGSFEAIKNFAIKTNSLI